jgi:hypothetical protein
MEETGVRAHALRARFHMPNRRPPVLAVTAAEMALLSVVGECVDWFRGEYGTAFCRERAGVDFWTFPGFLRYLMPPDCMLGCLSHISGTL